MAAAIVRTGRAEALAVATRAVMIAVTAVDTIRPATAARMAAGMVPAGDHHGRAITLRQNAATNRVDADGTNADGGTKRLTKSRPGLVMTKPKGAVRWTSVVGSTAGEDREAIRDQMTE